MVAILHFHKGLVRDSQHTKGGVEASPRSKEARAAPSVRRGCACFRSTPYDILNGGIIRDSGSAV